MCQVRNYAIKPLSLYQRVHQFDSSRPLNVLKLTGNFSIAEAHQWLNLLVSEIPDRTPPQDSVTFNFSSIFIGTQMQATYSRGSAIFSSDNISTIAIIRDILSKEMTKRQELADNVEDLSFLSTDTKQIMDSFDQLHKEMASSGTYFDRLTNITINLYIDRERMAGRNGKSKVDELLHIIRNYDYNKLLQFFMTKT
ncbi:unnamed protein product [Onchocerca ochengi]|uniref:Uncharacterized protein n=1 Tax=Onchocerca ochengi TaxID=42157 RepID=A0A182E3J5_ONCOC|nr:unnamed protein product [Onchocerca ochengi]